jgi:hypothetical protein
MVEHRPTPFSSDDEQRITGAAPRAGEMSDDRRCDQRSITLTSDEATRFLNALEGVDAATVARLRELRERRSSTG